MSKYQDALENVLKDNPKTYLTTSDIHKDIRLLLELVDKEKPMKPPLIWENANPKTRCKCTAGVMPKDNYCWNCGQKLDWSDKK